MPQKFTKAQRLDIGRSIYYGEITIYQAASRYNINPFTAREYMRLFRDANKLPPKNSRPYKSADKQDTAVRKPYQDMSREELLDEICRLRINEEHLKKAHQVKGGGGRKEPMPQDKRNTR